MLCIDDVVHVKALDVCGLRFFGSPWVPYHDGGNTGRAGTQTEGRRAVWQAARAQGASTPHKFDLVPSGVDILLTHGPAKVGRNHP